MNEISIQLGGLTLHHPASVITNVALTTQTGWFALRLSRHRSEDAIVWVGLFAWLSLGAALGVPKHGLPHLMGPTTTAFVRGGSNFALCAGVICFMLGTVQRHVRRGGAVPFLHFVAGLFAGSAVAVNLESQAMGPSGVLMAAGMVPVLLVETRHAVRHRHPSASALGIGLWLALLGGLAFAFQVSPSPWFTRTDVAHVAFLLGLPWMYRGADHWLAEGEPDGGAPWN
jgi:hypothetical protein